MERPLCFPRLNLLRTSTIFPETLRNVRLEGECSCVGLFSAYGLAQRWERQGEKKYAQRIVWTEGLKMSEYVRVAHTIMFRSMSVSP